MNESKIHAYTLKQEMGGILGKKKRPKKVKNYSLKVQTKILGSFG